MSKRFPSIKHLIKYNSNREDINFWAYFWRFFMIKHKTFWRKIPICPNTLWSKTDFRHIILLHDFAKSEICYFDFTVMEKDILRFDIIMDNYLALRIQIVYGSNELVNDKFSFNLRYNSILLQKYRKIFPFTVFKNCTETILIYFNCIKKFDNIWMIQLAMNLILS